MESLQKQGQGSGKVAGFAVVIPTKNRIEDLLKAVRSVVVQTLKPDEIIVIDQSVTNIAQGQIARILESSAEIKLKYILDKSLTGLTAAKNLAVKTAESDVLIFIDDDIVLDAGFIETLEATYRCFPELSGVGGVVRLPSSRQILLRNLVAPIFQIGPFYDVRSLLQYGYKTKAETIPVTILSGGLSSIKKEVFRREIFNEELHGASPIEDMDFFLRASRQFKFALATKATALHNVSQVSRAGLRSAFERKASGFNYIYKQYIPKTFFNFFAFFLKNTGIIVDALASSVMRFTWDPVIGVLSAWKIIPAAKKTNTFSDKDNRPVRMCIMASTPITLVFFYKGLLDFLVDKGFDVTVITSPDKEFVDKLSPRVKYIFIPMFRGMSPLKDLSALVRLVGTLKKGKFDIIQYSTPKAAFLGSIASWLCRIPVRLYLMWGLYYTGQTGLLKTMMKTVEKLTCFFSTHVSPDSYGNYHFAIAEGLCPSEKISVVGDGSSIGVDMDRFDPANLMDKRIEVRKKFNILPDSVVIGFVGRLCRDKGINELILAFKKLLEKNPGIYLLLVGPMEADIREFESEVQDMLQRSSSIIRTGYQDKPEEFLAAMDIFVLPSYREGFSTAILEASAMSLPVVSTDIPGSQSSPLNGEIGLLVPAKSVEGLRAGLETLIEDGKLRRCMGEAGRRWAKKFEQKSLWERIVVHRNALLNKAGISPKRHAPR